MEREVAVSIVEQSIKSFEIKFEERTLEDGVR